MTHILFVILGLATGALCAPPSHVTPYQDLTNFHIYDTYDSFGVDGDDYSGSVETMRLEDLEEALAEALRSGEEPPIVFLDDTPVPVVDQELQAPVKRTRFYRRYGNKKRQTANYLCAPSRDEVFRLLVALHEVRNGVNDKTIHFCNRKRPAKAVFTNIRFLGRR